MREQASREVLWRAETRPEGHGSKAPGQNLRLLGSEQPCPSQDSWKGGQLSLFLAGLRTGQSGRGQSPQREELLKLKAEFDALVPALPSSARGTQGGAPTRPAARASGSPDFSLDNGKKPLDVTRLLDLPALAPQELQARKDDRPDSESLVSAFCSVPSSRSACCAVWPMRVAYVDAPPSW